MSCGFLSTEGRCFANCSLTTLANTAPCLTAQVFKEEKYLRDAVECSDVIWQRGLLRKGYGICHGTAGNGYSFLSLYHLTQDKKYLYRACKVRTALSTQLPNSPEHAQCPEVQLRPPFNLFLPTLQFLLFLPARALPWPSPTAPLPHCNPPPLTEPLCPGPRPLPHLLSAHFLAPTRHTAAVLPHLCMDWSVPRAPVGILLAVSSIRSVFAPKLAWLLPVIVVSASVLSLEGH